MGCHRRNPQRHLVFTQYRKGFIVSHTPQSSHNESQRAVTTLRLVEMKGMGQKIACLTAYDALMARVLDEAGIDVLLVGDSLGNVVQGHETTIPVTLEDIIYHTRAVKRGAHRALVVADMPFMSYQVRADEAFRNAGRLMKEAGAGAVKLEGGRRIAEAVSRMTESGIPVMGHVGLTPQSINQFGTYRPRGRDEEEAQSILDDAVALEQAGAFAIVVEKVPSSVAQRITEAVRVPTIGIGAGPHCDGQILVVTDMLGLTVDFHPRFVRHYANLQQTINDAVRSYCADVRTTAFPTDSESYS